MKIDFSKLWSPDDPFAPNYPSRVERTFIPMHLWKAGARTLEDALDLVTARAELVRLFEARIEIWEDAAFERWLAKPWPTAVLVGKGGRADGVIQARRCSLAFRNGYRAAAGEPALENIAFRLWREQPWPNGCMPNDLMLTLELYVRRYEHSFRSGYRAAMGRVER